MTAIAKPLDSGINSLSKEIKQKIMDLLMGDRCLCIGQICKELNLSVWLVSGVIYQQIKKYQYIKREVE